MSRRHKRPKPAVEVITEREQRRAERRRARQDKTVRIKDSRGRLRKLPVKDGPPGTAWRTKKEEQ